MVVCDKCDKSGENKAASANLFLELGMGNSEIGIEYRTGNDHKFVWHIETWVIDKTVAISNILHFPQNRKSAREDLIFNSCPHQFENTEAGYLENWIFLPQKTPQNNNNKQTMINTNQWGDTNIQSTNTIYLNHTLPNFFNVPRHLHNKHAFL